MQLQIYKLICTFDKLKVKNYINMYNNIFLITNNVLILNCMNVKISQIAN